jgi:hypothetical protein
MSCVVQNTPRVSSRPWDPATPPHRHRLLPLYNSGRRPEGRHPPLLPLSVGLALTTTAGGATLPDRRAVTLTPSLLDAPAVCHDAGWWYPALAATVSSARPAALLVAARWSPEALLHAAWRGCLTMCPHMFLVQLRQREYLVPFRSAFRAARCARQTRGEMDRQIGRTYWARAWQPNSRWLQCTPASKQVDGFTASSFFFC